MLPSVNQPTRRIALAALAMVAFAAWATGQAGAFRGPPSVAPIAEPLIPAVVNISTSQSTKGPQGLPLPEIPKGSPFEDLFEEFFDRRSGPSAPRSVSSLGSGFVIDGKEGLVVTNNHVIADADEIIINFHDGSKLKVDKVLGRDAKSDLALLKVTPPKPLAEVKFGSSEKLLVGDWVMAIGNPFGLGGTLTVGIISAKQRDINSGPYDDYLQTDAAINRGNSGGPLFNMDG
ncbi:MAG: trypsin-like peptidase domain-containing protein, partial [Hyphomicrobiaceae bacterium]